MTGWTKEHLAELRRRGFKREWRSTETQGCPAIVEYWAPVAGKCDSGNHHDVQLWGDGAHHASGMRDGSSANYYNRGSPTVFKTVAEMIVALDAHMAWESML